MKAIYSACILDPWLDVAKELKRQRNIIPTYWISWNNDREKRIIQESFKECVFQDLPLAWKGIFPCLDNSFIVPELDGDIIKNYSREENIAMKMMDRQDPTGYNFSFNERQQFFRHLLRTWLYILEKYEIELVISPSIPHRVFDYALYVATMIKSVKFITFKMTVWPGYLIPLLKINEIPSFSQYKSQSSDLVLKYIAKTKRDYVNAEPYYMKDQRRTSSYGMVKEALSWLNEGIFVNKLLRSFKDSQIYWKQKGISIENSKFLNFQKRFTLKRGRLYKRKLKSHYDALSIIPDYSSKYIYLPLHYQPEETSCPSGDVYVDQFLLAETLLKYTPDNIDLYVKEHISQFHPLMEGEMGRSVDFYDRLKKFKRVKLISTNVNSFELIDHSIAVATITGTVGLEALIRRKPVLVFGTAWYEHLSGIFQIKTMKNLENAIAEILNGFGIDPIITEAELNNIFNNTIKAYHYGNYKEISGVSKEEATSNLVNCIPSLLDHEFSNR